MDERRRLKRRHLIYYLRVFNQANDNLIGHLVDLTTEGIMLISEEEIVLNQEYELRLNLPEEIENSREIRFKALSMWSKADVNPEFFDTGFKFLEISPRHLEIIRVLIEDFSFQD